MSENLNQQNIQMIEEDEIDLRELFAVIAKRKLFILVFSFVVTLLAVVYVLSKPNVYTVKTELLPVEATSGVSLGGLGGLASLAGVEIGGGGEISPSKSFEMVLNDYGLVKQFVRNNALDTVLLKPDTSNYYFALGYRGVYDFFNTPSDKEESDEEQDIYNTYKILTEKISISADKKTGVMTLSVSDPDMHLALNMLDLFLRKASLYLIDIKDKEIDTQLKYYEKTLKKIRDVQIKEQLSLQVSALIHSKIMLHSSPYYKVKKITEPVLPYYQDKSKPKRGLIVVVAFITSIMLSIFMVFFLEFIQNKNEEIRKA